MYQTSFNINLFFNVAEMSIYLYIPNSATFFLVIYFLIDQMNIQKVKTLKHSSKNCQQNSIQSKGILRLISMHKIGKSHENSTNFHGTNKEQFYT